MSTGPRQSTVATVETASGAVPIEELGTTLMHEHLFTFSSDALMNFPQTFDADRSYARVRSKLEAMKSRGVDTVVDLTVMGLGRDINHIAAIASSVDVNIIVATGCYNRNGVPPPYFMYQSDSLTHPTFDLPPEEPDALVQLFMTDIQDGIAGSGIKAAILKCVTDVEGLTAGNVRVLRAVARTHLATGVPISTHSDSATRRGLDQQMIFAEEGVDLSRVVIGHAGDSTDLNYLEELLANGSYLGMARFGYDHILSFEERVGVVAELCRRGHANRMVLSHDSVCSGFFALPGDLTDRVPWPHLTDLHDTVLPALRARGVSQADIEQMLVANPRAIFTGS